MSVSISAPNGPVSSGDMVCVTVSGVSNPPPDVRLKFGSGIWEPANVTAVGGGNYIVWFQVPQNSGTVRISASSGGGASDGSVLVVPVRA